MNMDEESLESLLQARAGRQDQTDEPELQDQAEKLGGLAEKFQAFVSGQGDLEGALFEELVPLHDVCRVGASCLQRLCLRSELSDDSGDSDPEDEPTQPKKTAEERQKDQDALVAPLPDSEWGQKEPPAHTPAPPLPPASATANDISEPRLEPENYEGASDDSSEASDLENDDEANIQELPEDADVDMNSEMHDFLKFTREALGLSEDQYADILQSRKERGGWSFSGSFELTNLLTYFFLLSFCSRR